jgi:Tol biopolymer transport system component
MSGTALAVVASAAALTFTGAAGRVAAPGCPERAPFASDEPENAAPAWSPDGRSLAFQSTRTGRTQLYVIDVETCAVRPVGDVRGYAPDWSPDGRRLVFRRFDPDEDALWTAAVDGSGLRRLTTPRRASDMFPSWSRRRNVIAFDRANDSEPEIERRELFVVQPDGRRLRRIVKGGWNITPEWSPDGRWIAWARSWRGNEQIWRMRPDGSRKTRLTPGFANGDADPTWSPDGRRIAYSGSTATVGLTVWVKPVTGGRPRNVVGGANASDPDWSPDGRWIAFARHQGELTHLYLVRPDGTGLRPLALASPRR